MSTAKTVTTILHGVTRLNNSVNGNPRFTLHTDDGDFTLQSDAACGYEVTNYSNRAPVAVKLTMRGKTERVYGIDEA